MSRFYAAQQIGVLDGTKIPADRANGQVVGAKKSIILATKPAAAVYAAGDDIVLGELRPGEIITGIRINSDTTLGTTTVAIGIAGNTGKYVAARTFTTPLDAPTSIGPKASVLAAGPVAAKETILATLAVGGIAAGVNVTIELEIASVK